MATYNHFYDLSVYQKCRLFRKNVSQTVKNNFPKSEEYHLKSQIFRFQPVNYSKYCRGIWQIPLPGKHSVLKTIRGSLTETMDHLITAFDEEYINSDQLKY